MENKCKVWSILDTVYLALNLRRGGCKGGIKPKAWSILEYWVPLALELRQWMGRSLIKVIHVLVTTNHPDYDEIKGGDFGLITSRHMNCLPGKSRRGTGVFPRVGQMWQRGGPSHWEKMFILLIVVIWQWTILTDDYKVVSMEERNAEAPRKYCWHAIFCGLLKKEKIGC